MTKKRLQDLSEDEWKTNEGMIVLLQQLSSICYTGNGYTHVLTS